MRKYFLEKMLFFVIFLLKINIYATKKATEVALFTAVLIVMLLNFCSGTFDTFGTFRLHSANSAICAMHFFHCSLRRILSDMNFALRFLRLLRHFSFNSFNL